LAVLALVLAFTVKNQSSVTMSFWPFDVEATLPLAILVIGLLFLGFFLGSFVAWCGSLKYRFEARGLRKEVAALRKKAQAASPDVITQTSSGEPVIPSPAFSKRKFLGFGS